MIILGIWDGHDAGAALLVDGRLAAAVNEERLSRRKLDVAFPAASIRTCLDMAGLPASAVSIVAASTTDPAKTLGRLMPWTKERYYAVRRRRARPGALARATFSAKQRMTAWRPNAVTQAMSRSLVARACRRHGLTRATVTLLDHHACHAWAAAAACPFDTCAVVTIDGLGDGVSASIREFRDGRLGAPIESAARDSLGVFFEHVTRLLNMRELEDEGKVMALADYAAPIPDQDNPLLPCFTIENGVIRTRIASHAWTPALAEILWSTPNEQFAHLAQRTVESVACALARQAVARTGQRRIALAGGVASNVKMNRRLRLLADVDEVYVFPHMGDGGLALGAAIAATAGAGAAPRIDLSSLSIGPAYSVESTDAAIREAGLRAGHPTDLAAAVADRLAQGQIVCWFQGGMEYGPRALGHRSILARPDRVDLRDRLNLVLKRRVWYQPFCPSLLESEACRLLEDWTAGGQCNRAMTMAYGVTAAGRAPLAGVMSVDGTCRPHVMRDDDPQPFGALLRAVRARLGAGALLNTSFNIHGEPLVCSPREALDVFVRGGADALAIGPYLIEPPDRAASSGAEPGR